MHTCIIYTFAYNAQNTLIRTANSLLNQTYTNWIWHLVDNGSTDNTSKIIQSLANQDSRIIVHTNKNNNVWEDKNGWWRIARKYNDNQYFCFIDADDEYKPDFLEKMLPFAYESKLDIAVCGNDNINAITNTYISSRVLSSNIVINNALEYGVYFPYLHQFMRTMWGKLYKISNIKKLSWDKMPKVSYGWDTLFATENFRVSNCVGVLNESLHRYYINPTSLSYKFDSYRVKSDQILYRTQINFLKDKVGSLSPSNLDFLLVVYMNSLFDTLNILLKSNLSISQKLTYILEIGNCDFTKQLAISKNLGFSIKSPNTEKKLTLFNIIADFLISITDVSDEILLDFCDVSEYIYALLQNSDAWIMIKQVRIDALKHLNMLNEAKVREIELSNILNP